MKLDLKKLINNVLSRLVIHSVYFTATTTAAGQLALANLVPDDAQIISARCTSNSAYMCLPWMYTSSAGVAVWYLRVMNWNTFATANSVSVTVRVRYIMGGILRNPVIARLLAIFKIGGGIGDGEFKKDTSSCTCTSDEFQRKAYSPGIKNRFCNSLNIKHRNYSSGEYRLDISRDTAIRGNMSVRVVCKWLGHRHRCICSFDYRFCSKEYGLKLKNNNDDYLLALQQVAFSERRCAA